MREIKVMPPTREVALNSWRDIGLGIPGTYMRRYGRHDTGLGAPQAMPECRKGRLGRGLAAFSLRKPPGIRIVRTLSGLPAYAGSDIRSQEQYFG
jgi:hypothetical protein